MQKEILTKEKIKKELRACLLCDIKEFLLFELISLPALILITYLFFNIKHSVPNFIIFFPLTYVFLVLFFCTITLIKLYHYLKAVKNKNFEIEIDLCLQTKEIHDRWGLYALKNHIWVYKRRNYRIFFKNHGEYAIRSGKNYLCSDMYEMDEKSVYNYTNEGDKFYLILLKKKVILLVYNTKLFELK